METRLVADLNGWRLMSFQHNPKIDVTLIYCFLTPKTGLNAEYIERAIRNHLYTESIKSVSSLTLKVIVHPEK